MDSVAWRTVLALSTAVCACVCVGTMQSMTAILEISCWKLILMRYGATYLLVRVHDPYPPLPSLPPFRLGSVLLVSASTGKPEVRK